MGRKRKKKYPNTSARSLGHNSRGCNNESDYNLNRLINEYTNIALNVYEWTNLPDGIESRHIESALFNVGQVFFFQEKEIREDIVLDDEIGGRAIALPCSPAGSFNYYSDPTSLLITGRGYSKTKKTKEGVRILNNNLATPTIVDIEYYCKKINDLEFAIQRNLKYQNSPYIYYANSNTKYQAELIQEKIDSGDCVVIVDEEFGVNTTSGLQTIDIKKEFIADKLRKEQQEYEKLLLTRLGLNCTLNKEGGMSETELNSNNMLIEMHQSIGLRKRKEGRDLINKMFGYNIDVKAVADSLHFMCDENGNFEKGEE